MNGNQPDRDAILTMARLAGLRLPAAYENELVDAYTHVRALVLRLPEPRARGDEPAHVFNPARFVAKDD
ncbi:MAG TPA: hypothetical protein VGN97_03140 [Mesorhizobium sp.]|nr:hypothetical protein [Mesorhizobium sp.]